MIKHLLIICSLLITTQTLRINASQQELTAVTEVSLGESNRKKP